MYWIYYIVILLNLVCLLTNKKNKFIQVISFLFIIVLMAGNTWNGDYIGYENYYNGYADPHFQDEYGINLVFAVGNAIGVSYQCVLFFIFLVCLLINSYVAKKMDSNMHVFYGVYLVFGILADTVVMRNYIALTFLTLAIYHMLNNNKKCFLIYLCIAFLFHKTMLFFFPLILINLNNKDMRKIIKYFGTTIVMLCFLVFALGGRFQFLALIIANIMGYGEGNIYLTGTTRYGFLLYFMVHLATIFVIYMSKMTLVKRYERSVSIDERLELENKITVLEKMLTINFYVIAIFPLIMISVQMHRIYRNILIVNICSLGLTSNSFSNNKVSKSYYQYLAWILLFTVIWRVLYIFENPTCYKAIMENNLIVDFFNQIELVSTMK